MQKNYFVTGRLNYSMAFKLQSVKFELRLPSNVPNNGLTLDGGGQATHGKKTFLSVLFS